MQLSIPVTEELYSVYLEGFLLCKVRYNDLHLWDEQLHRVFGSGVPSFPPKFFLAQTKAMADERRLQLEKYLQELVSDPSVSSSEIFIEFFKKLQLETYKMPSIKIILNVYLPNGEQIKVDAQTSDTAERVLELALYKLNLSRELMEFFSFFLTRRESNGTYTVVKRIVDFEIPFLTVWGLEDERFQIDIKKWYMNPSIDAMLMGCTTSINLLYIQALQEMEMKWAKPTEAQRRKLEHLSQTEDKIKFLELMQEVHHYGYIQLGPCTSDYPEPFTPVNVSVGNAEMNCCFMLAEDRTKNISFHINNFTSWQVTFIQAHKGAAVPVTGQQLEFKLEYRQGDALKWLTIYTEKAFLLSSCLKKILCEQPVTRAKEDLEIDIETSTTKKSSRKHEQVGGNTENKTLLTNKSENKAFGGFSDIDL
ncbi:hypothetical protein FKM82_005900 [Ascaphus truei]